MTQQSLVIVIITYKRPRSLERTLMSLLAQSCPEGIALRLLIMDNDAERSAESIVSAFSEQAPWPVGYGVATERGIPLARNAALAHAGNVDWVAFIDDDDTAHKDWISALVSCARAYRADIVAGKMAYHFPEGYAHLSQLDLFADAGKRTGELLDSAWSGNVLLHTKLCRQWKLMFDPAFRFTGGSDHHFFSTAFSLGAKIVFCREAVVESQVPLSRTTRGWLMRRALRNGAVMSLSDRKLLGRRGGLNRIVLHLRSSLHYNYRLFKRAAKGHVPWLQPLLIMCFTLGRIIGYAGIVPQEYRHHIPEE